MFDWKIVLAVFAALLLLGGGLLKDLGKGIDQKGLGNFLEEIKDRIGEIISLSDFSISVTRDIKVSGEVGWKGEYDFKNIKVDSVWVKYDPGLMNLTVDEKNVRINKEAVDLLVDQFRGNVHLSQRKVDLEGKVNSLSSQPISLKGDEISVQLDGDFTRLSLKNIEMDQLDLGSEGGQLEVGPSVSISLEEKPVKLHSFRGDLTFFDQNLQITGNVSKVTSGKERVSISTS